MKKKSLGRREVLVSRAPAWSMGPESARGTITAPALPCKLGAPGSFGKTDLFVVADSLQKCVLPPSLWIIQSPPPQHDLRGSMSSVPTITDELSATANEAVVRPFFTAGQSSLFSRLL